MFFTPHTPLIAMGPPRGASQGQPLFPLWGAGGEQWLNINLILFLF